MKKAKGTIKIAVAAYLFIAATQIPYLANKVYQALHPSAIRQEFQEEFAFPIQGWEEDIEDNPRQISLIAGVLYQERAELPFNLDSFKVQSDQYLKWNLLEQASAIVWGGSDKGSYYLNKITVENKATTSTVRHEIKHAKTKQIAKNHPEFVSRWEALASNEQGQSLYGSLLENILGRLYWLENFTPPTRFSAQENEKKGFVSNYARTDVLEDIAELGTLAEENPLAFEGWLSPEGGNALIARKVALAQE